MSTANVYPDYDSSGQTMWLYNVNRIEVLL